MSANSPFERAAKTYQRAAIAHERPESVEAGMEALEAGGNAMDAAVAVALAACVVMPAATSIAGSGLMLVKPAEGGQVTSIEFPSRAPLGATPDMFDVIADDGRTADIGVSAVKDAANLWGGLAPGVPAGVAGLCSAHAQFGRLPLATVIAPAVDLARHGFRVTPEFHAQTLMVLPALRRSPPLRGMLLTKDGLPLVAPRGQEGPLVVQSELARTLHAIGERGPEAFYAGEIADALVTAARQQDGVLTIEDMSRYTPIITAPLAIKAGDATVYAPASPSGAWTELQILAAMAHAGLLDRRRPFDLRTYVEISRRCFADRFHLMGDPDYVEPSLEMLLEESYTESLATAATEGLLAYPASVPWDYYASHVPPGFAHAHPEMLPTPWQGLDRQAAPIGDSSHTTHLSVVDEDGMVVSCTMTAGHLFGSTLMGAGVLLDNAMLWFNACPGRANSIAPWKRPLANMGPLIVEREDGTVLAVGAPGGRRIMSAVTQVVAHWLRGDAVTEATARPRVDASDGVVLVSCRMPDADVERLSDHGYVMRAVEDRGPFCWEFARPIGVATSSDGAREAATQPFVAGSVGGR